MNLKFESVVENLEENLSKNFEKSLEDKNLEVALNDADVLIKDALENGKEIGNKKELVIKNANDEKIAAIELGETKVIKKNAEKDEVLLTKQENKSFNILENKKMEELGIDPKKGASKLQTFIEKAERLGFIGKVLAAVGRIGGTLVDSIAKKYLKDKFKVNYSTYNDGKKALQAAIKKDGQTFFKKGFDVIFSSFKKLPATTKMVFRNVKNKVVEEAFSLGKFLIAK
ncbi:MAG: hypothetical protein IKJ32_00510 [Clostridia bacterium]|nr:hypothetical protein [Clostridia bacterium]